MPSILYVYCLYSGYPGLQPPFGVRQFMKFALRFLQFLTASALANATGVFVVFVRISPPSAKSATSRNTDTIFFSGMYF